MPGMTFGDALNGELARQLWGRYSSGAVAAFVGADILVWGNGLVWGNILVWGNEAVTSDILVWGDNVQSDILVWGNILVWGRQLC